MNKTSPGEFARRTQYKATIETIRTDRSPEGLFQLTESALLFTQKMLVAVADKSSPLPCRAGCDHCCYLMATVSGPEALTISHRLKESRTQEELKSLKREIKAAYQATKKMDNLDRARSGIPCPFLTEQGVCSIYEFRPMDCATYHSLDVQACRDILERPDQGHPTNPVMKSIGMGIKAGLGQGINQSRLERPALRYELIEAIHISLHDRRVMDKYLAGENPLQPAAIVIDPQERISYKIRNAPSALKEQALSLIARERRTAHRVPRQGRGQHKARR